jgi:dipeptide transport system substrate-binding protein
MELFFGCYMNYSRRLIAYGLLFLCAFAAHAKTLTFCTEGSPETFTPALSTNATSFDVAAQMYEGLVTFRTGTTEVVPALATRWTVSSDGLEYVFFLREGVKWQGNSAFQPTRDFNADDVLFTFERQWKKNHPYFSVTSDKHPYFSDTILMQLKSIEKLDDHAVKFILTEPSAPFVSNLAMRWAGIQSAEYAEEMLKWTSHGTVDKLEPQIEARSNASGLTPPK